MRRPAVPVMAAFAVGIICEYVAQAETNVCVIICVVAVFAAWFFAGKEQRRLWVCLALIFSAGFMLTGLYMYDEGEEAGAGREVNGVVLSVREKRPDNLKIEVETDKGRVLISYFNGIENSRNLIGRQVTALGDVEEPKGRSNPGCFDYRLYLKSRKITKVMKAGDIKVGPVENSLRHRLAVFRTGFEENVTKGMGEDEAAITIAMLFGDKSALDDDVYESFQRNGTAHILAVSALHVGMIYALLSSLIGGRRKIGVNIIMAAILFSYAALADFSPSVMRAVIMIFIHIISKICHERYDIISSACVTGLIMLAMNPYALFGAGFQLSFFAVSLIGMLLPLFEKVKLPDPIRKAALPGIVVQFGMAPLTAYMFNYFSFIGFLVNIPVVFVAGLIVPFGVILMFVEIAVPGLTADGGGVLGGIVEMMIKINHGMYMGGRAAMDVASPPLWVIAVFYAALYYAASEHSRILWLRKERKKWLAELGLLISAGLFFGIIFGNPFSSAQCIFVDVGQGSCVHLRTPSGEDLLVDGGGKTSFGATEEEREKYDYDVGEIILRPYLLKNGVTKVDIAMVTHLDADHYKGIASICRRGMVKRLALHECLKSEEEKVLTETKMNKKNLIYLKTGQVFKSKGFSMKVVGPPTSSLSGGGNSDNENSMVIKAQWVDFSALVTGDIDENVERNLIAAGADIKADVVAVPHHGSKYSSTEEFIKATRSKAAVIQVGKNNYGHPAPEVIRRYKAAGVRVYRNDQQGAVGICEKKIKTMKSMRGKP